MMMKRLGILLGAGILVAISGCGKEKSNERLIDITVRQEKLQREVGRIITGVKGVRTELDQILALAKKGSAAPGPAKAAHAPRTEAVDLKDVPEYKQLAAAVSAIEQRLNVAQSNVLRTKEEIERRSSFPVLSISQTGALTITIDQEGNMKMKGFLKENLPSLEGGS